MKSPLAVDKETMKKYGVTKDIDVSPMLKLSFLETQLQEIQHAMWRARVDIIHATRLTESENDTLKNKGFQNMADHVNQVQQFTGAIKMIKSFIEELKEEYPELKA
jgi:predicted Ser/Thr protein kinase